MDSRGRWSADGWEDTTRSINKNSNSNSNYYGPKHSHDDDEGLDEFGLKRERRDTMEKEGQEQKRRKESNDEEEKKSSRPQPRPRREWPPNFETDSGAFIFDGRSGMFYEAESDFFYGETSIRSVLICMHYHA